MLVIAKEKKEFFHADPHHGAEPNNKNILKLKIK